MYVIDALDYTIYQTDFGAIRLKEAIMADVHSLGTTQSAAQARDRRAKFVDLAEKRTINAIKGIRVIGKLGNRSHYVYDESDVKKIVAALTREIDSLKARMLTKGSRDSVEFKL